MGMAISKNDKIQSTRESPFDARQFLSKKPRFLKIISRDVSTITPMTFRRSSGSDLSRFENFERLSRSLMVPTCAHNENGLDFVSKQSRITKKIRRQFVSKLSPESQKRMTIRLRMHFGGNRKTIPKKNPNCIQKRICLIGNESLHVSRKSLRDDDKDDNVGNDCEEKSGCSLTQGFE